MTKIQVRFSSAGRPLPPRFPPWRYICTVLAILLASVVSTHLAFHPTSADTSGLVSAAGLSSTASLATDTLTLIPRGATWQYLANGSNQGTAWRGRAFSDTAWPAGRAQLGYGDGDEATVISYGPNNASRYVTSYFRYKFNVADASQVQSLSLSLVRDDGAVVYLNGTEVYRSNMPAGTIGYRTLASGVATGGAETTFYTASPNRDLLVSGSNVVAVEVHLPSRTDSDLSFDLGLSGQVAATSTATPTATRTTVPTATRTAAPTATRTAVPTATRTAVPTATRTAVPTATRTAVPTATRTAVPTANTTPTGVPTMTSTPTTDWQPALPLRAVFYYPWFPEGWTQLGIYPYSKYKPTLDYYNSGDTTVIKQHIAAMQYGNIAVGISSWWGQGTPTDNRMPAILAAAAGSHFRWAVYHEAEGNYGDPSVSAINADLIYLRDHYGSDPSYLRINGRFVVFVYGDANDACGMADRWNQANTVNAYIVLKVFGGYQNCASQPAGWHQYAPAAAADGQGVYSYTISPGFDKVGEATRLARDIVRWRQNIRDMIASSARFQLVTTFSEWGEGTPVESATQWASASGYGLYLDALHDNGALP